VYEGRVALEEAFPEFPRRTPWRCAYVLEFVAKERERKKSLVASMAWQSCGFYLICDEAGWAVGFVCVSAIKPVVTASCNQQGNQPRYYAISFLVFSNCFGRCSIP
jgi:hypothetical protein